MTLCLIISATAAPLVGTAKKSYPLYQPEVVKAELAPSMHKAPAATQGLQYDAEAGELIRYYNETDQVAINADYLSQGNLYVDIMAGDYSDYLSLLLFVEDTVEGAIIPEGTYPITSEPAYNTALASQGYSQTQGVIPCAYYPLVEQSGQLYISTPMYFMQSGNIVVEHVNGNPKITINAVNSNNVPMTIVFEVGGKSEKVEVKVPLQYDATANDGALDYTFAEDATATATDKGFYGTYVVDAADASCELGLLFIYPEGVADAETTIPEGTYTISDSQDPGTVMASSGYSSQGLGYSFFINVDAEGYIELPMYFLVDGTVEVTKVDGKLKVEVTGTNSNDVPIHIVYDATPAEEESAVPTNAELWEAFKPYYNEYYGLARADQPIDKVSTFAAAKMQEIMTDEASEYKWLGDYVLNVAAGQGVNLPTDMAAANEGAWRWAVHAFFNATTGANGAAGTDFTEAGKPENWGPYYLAAQQKPEEPTVEVMELTMTNLQVSNYGDATGLWASEMDNGIEVMLFLDAEGNLMAESSIMVGWMDYPVTGTVTKAYNEELATDVYTAELYTTVGETNYKLIITMYYVPAEATPVVVENATIDDQTEEAGFMYMYGEWADADGVIYPVSAEVPGFDATAAEAVYKNVTVTVGGWGDEDPWLGFVQGDATITIAEDVVTLTGVMSSWDGLTLDVTITGTLPAVAEPVEIVGVVKRAVQNGDEVIVLTHEADGTAHIYQVVDGKAVAELSQEGVIAVDPENAGDLLAISDIAVTEDGKLIAINKIVCQAGDAQVDEGYKRGETRVYIWNDLAGAPSVWFTSKMSSNWYRSVQGHTMAYKGTSTNGTLVTTGVTATGVKFRYSVYNVIDGVYTDPAVNDSEYYHYTKGDAQTTDLLGANYELNVSPLAENTWVLDGKLVDPFEITDPLTYNTEVTASATVNEDFGKKYNGATYVTVGEQVWMVAPFATPAGDLVAVQILDITNGLGAAQYVDMLYLEESVAATAAATAVEVVEGGLIITLVADATIYTLELPLGDGPGDDYQMYEDAITNLVIDYDNMLLIGGPSEAFQVEVVLGLGDYDRNTDAYQLLPASTISVLGSEATFIDGVASVDGIEQTATAVVHCTWNGMALEFHLTMSAAPLEATKVVVENAAIEIEKVLLWGDMYDYTLKMTGVWTNESIDYPVLVEVPVYYPESTEPYEIYSTVTVGGMGDDDPWLGFGEGYLTITQEGNTITATGIVENSWAGIAIDITISGTITPTGLENATVTVKPVKTIQNGQLIIEKDGVQYNVNGAIVK